MTTVTRRRFRRPGPALVALVVLTGLLLSRLHDGVDDRPAETRSTTVRVARVIDGDTVRADDGRRIRLLGIDAPEIGYDGEPSEPGAEAAREWLDQRIGGSSIELRLGPEEFDRYGRTLAWIYLPGGELINQELLRAGHARLLTRYGLPADLSAELHQAAAEARVRQLGIWKKE